MPNFAQTTVNVPGGEQKVLAAQSASGIVSLALGCSLDPSGVPIRGTTVGITHAAHEVDNPEGINIDLPTQTADAVAKHV